MNKQQIMELADYFMPVGIVDWSNQLGKYDEAKKQEVKVYINMLEFEAFCLPDDIADPIKDRKEMFMFVVDMLHAQNFDLDAKSIKGNTQEGGYFVRVGGISTFDRYCGKRRPKSAPPPVKDKQISIYIRVPKLNKSGFTDSEERLIKNLADIIIRQNDNEIYKELKNNAEQK